MLLTARDPHTHKLWEIKTTLNLPLVTVTIQDFTFLELIFSFFTPLSAFLFVCHFLTLNDLTPEE